MKNKIISLSIIAIMVIGCGETELSTEQKIQSNIEAELLPRLNDPESYEFVSVSEIDTVTVKDNAIDILEWSNEQVAKLDSYDGYNKQIEDIENDISEYKNIDAYSNYVKDSQDLVVRIKSIRQDIMDKNKEYRNDVEKSNDTDIHSITLIYKLRAKNAMGAKTLNSYKYILNDTLGVKSYKLVE